MDQNGRSKSYEALREHQPVGIGHARSRRAGAFCYGWWPVIAPHSHSLRPRMPCQPRSLPESFYAVPVIQTHFQFRLFLKLLHLNNIQIALFLTLYTSPLVLPSTLISSPPYSHRSHPPPLPYFLHLSHLPHPPSLRSQIGLTPHLLGLTLLSHPRRSPLAPRPPLNRPHSRVSQNGIHRVSVCCKPHGRPGS
jgi:hypothetical protein